MNDKIVKILSNWKFQTMIFFIFFVVGIFWHAWDVTYPYMVILTPFVLLISGLWAIYRGLSYRYMIVWIIIAYVVTFLLEVLGSSTGFIFGPYFYGNTLGLMFLDVPIVIGLNWVFIIFSLVLFSEWLVKERLKVEIDKKLEIMMIAFLTACFATIFDFILEPAAVGLSYWTWTLTSDPYNIPVQNYIAWFIISFIFALTYLIIPKDKRIKLGESPHSPWFVIIQVIFFFAIRIVLIFK
ncbi:MAG: carotenoid biosynthesis protein [Candidatus Lokiarchaeota archaeon]|nr:carotenoid biosynthesis protein [Candidatus Lokiarchaeota archaeon]MBD3200989.1 carotenoid biosynthesis protein [Candidatus Lokiarchaeota archaeon]